MCEFIKFFAKIGNEKNKIEKWFRKLQKVPFESDSATCITPLTRGLYWRLMLGVLPSIQQGMNVGFVWHDILSQHHEIYLSTKHLFSTSQSVVLVQDIEKDLRRLHFSNSGGSVPPNFFLQKERYEKLFNILYIWCIKNSQLSYRQGMHEICAIAFYVLESELQAWGDYCANVNDSDGDNDDFTSDTGLELSRAFTLDRIESYTYVLFDRLMKELGALYDPAIESYSILHYCHRIQEDLLFKIDPDLQYHLQLNEIQAPYYGISWARLMLAREFRLSDDAGGLLRIWDALIAFTLVIPDDVDGVSCANTTTISASTPATMTGFTSRNPTHTLTTRRHCSSSSTTKCTSANQIASSELSSQPSSAHNLNTSLPTRQADLQECNAARRGTLPSSLTSAAEMLLLSRSHSADTAQASVASLPGKASTVTSLRNPPLESSSQLGLAYTPLLLAIEYFILAVLISLRETLLAGNMYDILALLMEFVYEGNDVYPLIALAEAISRNEVRFPSTNKAATNAARVVVPIEESVKQTTRVFVDLIDERALVPLIDAWEAGLDLSGEVMAELWLRVWKPADSHDLGGQEDGRPIDTVDVTHLTAPPTTEKECMTETEFRSFLISIWVAQLVNIKKKSAENVKKYRRSSWLWASKKRIQYFENSTHEKVVETEQKLESVLMTQHAVHKVFEAFDTDKNRQISKAEFIALAPELLTQLLGPPPDPSPKFASPLRGPIMEAATKMKNGLNHRFKELKEINSAVKIPRIFPPFSSSEDSIETIYGHQGDDQNNDLAHGSDRSPTRNRAQKSAGGALRTPISSRLLSSMGAVAAGVSAGYSSVTSSANRRQRKPHRHSTEGRNRGIERGGEEGGGGGGGGSEDGRERSGDMRLSFSREEKTEYLSASGQASWYSSTLPVGAQEDYFSLPEAPDNLLQYQEGKSGRRRSDGTRCSTGLMVGEEVRDDLEQQERPLWHRQQSQILAQALSDDSKATSSSISSLSSTHRSLSVKVSSRQPLEVVTPPVSPSPPASMVPGGSTTAVAKGLCTPINVITNSPRSMSMNVTRSGTRSSAAKVHRNQPQSRLIAGGMETPETNQAGTMASASSFSAVGPGSPTRSTRSNTIWNSLFEGSQWLQSPIDHVGADANINDDFCSDCDALNNFEEGGNFHEYSPLLARSASVRDGDGFNEREDSWHPLSPKKGSYPSSSNSSSSSWRWLSCWWRRRCVDDVALGGGRDEYQRGPEYGLDDLDDFSLLSIGGDGGGPWGYCCCFYFCCSRHNASCCVFVMLVLFAVAGIVVLWVEFGSVLAAIVHSRLHSLA